MCGCGAEVLPWEACGVVDAGGSGEPEFHSLSSSSSESTVNSFGGSGTEIPSRCGTGQRADGIFVYTIVHFFFLVMPPKTAGTVQKKQSVVWIVGSLQTIGTANCIAYFCHSATVKYLSHICGSIGAGPRICLGRRCYIRNKNDKYFHYAVMVFFCLANVTSPQM